MSVTDFVLTQPSIPIGIAEEFVERTFGLSVKLSPLQSERDQNFLAVDQRGGGQFVLKIANAQTDTTLLDLENQIMLRLSGELEAGLIPVPSQTVLAPNSNADPFIAELIHEKQTFGVRLVNFLPGELFSNTTPRSDALLQDLGRRIGQITNALEGFDHPAAYRKFHWDLDLAAETISSKDSAVGEFPELDVFLRRYRETVLKHVPKLRKSVIHNDANDNNILVAVDWPQRISGIIDFGDVVYSSTINELAIGVAYVMLEQPDPLWSASQVISGFDKEFELTDLELSIVFELACMRLCTSVAMAAHQRSLQPENEYLSITDLPARNLLNKLTDVQPEYAEAFFRSACNRNPTWFGSRSPKSAVDWIVETKQKAFPILGESLTIENVCVLDVSVSSPDCLTGDLDAFRVSEELEQRATGRKVIGVGRYCEPRICYQGDQFQNSVGCSEDRSIHLGVDLFAPAGTELYSPFDGVIHSFADNALAYDYGPTIILEHQISDVTFYTLYGHLSRESLDSCEIGKRIAVGEKFATFGDPTVNGGWPPHVHFQIMTHMFGMQGDFPGVAIPRDQEFWKGICPDPNLLLGIPREAFPPDDWSNSKIEDVRARHLNPSLSVSYSKPVHVVRGEGQFFYDANGQRYLDCVNNVCHVGHCHPKVIAAATNQLGVLNTNTRYLHENVVRYAERLVAMLPAGLDVCYFVNSGSEANDLALRLARNFSNRKGVICVDGGYHGHTESLIEVSPYKFDSPGGSGCPHHVHKVPMPDPFRGIHRKPEYQQAVSGAACLGDFYASFIRTAIADADSEGQGFAAFICESILSCGGQIVLPEGFLPAAYSYARDHGAVCIADEVQVGFGRIGSHFWGFELQDVVPDIVTMGKPIGNGHPLAAVVTTREIADAFHNGMEYFNTFGGNPVSCAIGLAVLDVIEDEGLRQNAEKVGEYFLNRLRELQVNHRFIGDVRGCGLFLGIEFVEEDSDLLPNPRIARYVAERMRDHRILLSTDGPDHNVIKIKPPMVFTKSNVDQVVDSISEILRESYVTCFGRHSFV